MIAIYTITTKFGPRTSVQAKPARRLEENQSDSLGLGAGGMSLLRWPNLAGFERATYLPVLQR